MKLRTNVFDLWVFRQDPDAVRYLLMRTSQEKTDKWFGGGRFWQIPDGYIHDGENILEAIRRALTEISLVPQSIWAVEHTYTIYNRRGENLEIIPVFAAEVERAAEVSLTWEHSEACWLMEGECQERVRFRGLLEGLEWTRHCITEADERLPELRLA